MRMLTSLLVIFFTVSAWGAGVELQVHLPEGITARDALATARRARLDTPGQVKDRVIVFSNLLPDMPYDLRITLADGTILNGVDLNWYEDHVTLGDGQLDDDAREQIRAIVQDVPSFHNKINILRLIGDGRRAVALIELIRDTDFYAGKGQVVWRMEVWYFREQAGGWERVALQTTILDRQRFATVTAYRDYVSKRRWLPELGGIRISADQGQRTLTLTPQAVAPTTRPGSSPAAP